MDAELLFLDALIKQEPQTVESSGGVPIPARPGPRNNIDFSDLGLGEPYFGQQQFVSSFGLDQPLTVGSLPTFQQPPTHPSVWVSLCDTFKMDEDDDILQVDESDLIQGPTLAELNDEALLEDLSFDDLLLPDSNSSSFPINLFSQKEFSSSFPTSRGDQASGLSCSVPASQGLFVGIPSPPAGPLSPRSATSSRHSTLHELLMRRNEPQEAQSPGSSTLLSTAVAGPSRLSSSAPTHLGLEQIWQRREPRQHLLSTGSLVEAGSTSSLSTGGVLSPASHELSHDEGFDSEDDSEHYDDFSSDGDSSDGDDKPRSARQKKERYFWQYNVQAKGPKGQRLVLKTKQEDPHFLNEVTDPVFSPSCAVRGIKHSGKARKGDGNDLTPNPRKLHSIGKELDKLGRVINDMTPVSELPLTVRPKSRKEKNKLASRACRLKKKAQHEANKIKLFGLEHEHKRLITGIAQIKGLLASSYSSDSKQREELTRSVEKLRRLSLKLEIAGISTEFVNKVLEKVKAGVPGGGLDDIL